MRKLWLDPGQLSISQHEQNLLEKEFLSDIQRIFSLNCWKLLLQNIILEETVNSQYNTEQLTCLNDTLEEKRSFSGHGYCLVILLHRNYCPQVANMTEPMILELGFKVCPHILYILQTCPIQIIYHMSYTMKHALSSQWFQQVHYIEIQLSKKSSNQNQNHFKFKYIICQ